MSDILALARPEIRALVPAAAHTKAAAAAVRLHANENPWPDEADVSPTALNRYFDGQPQALVDALAAHYGVDPASLLVTRGSDEAIDLLVRAFCRAGEDRILVCPPTFGMYRFSAEVQGAGVLAVPLADDFRLDDEALIRRWTPDVKVVFLCSPNNPTGIVEPPEVVKALVASAPGVVVVDEAYVDFADANCLALVRKHENILVTRSLSKSYALAGLRFGFVVAQPQMIEQLRKVKDSYNCDALSIAGATAAIDDQTWLQETRAAILATRERMMAALRELGFASVPSQANFVWNPHPSVPVEPLYQKLKAAGVLVRYMNYALWGDGLRISVGTDEQVDACLDLLKTLV